MPGSDFQVMNARAGGDDIDDGVYCADLVEVDVLYGDVMDFGFGLAEEFEGADGGLLDGVVEFGGLDEGSDGRQGAAVGVRALFGVRIWIVMVVVGMAGLVLVLGLRLVGVASVWGLVLGLLG